MINCNFQIDVFGCHTAAAPVAEGAPIATSDAADFRQFETSGLELPWKEKAYSYGRYETSF